MFFCLLLLLSLFLLLHLSLYIYILYICVLDIASSKNASMNICGHNLVMMRMMMNKYIYSYKYNKCWRARAFVRECSTYTSARV